MLEGKKVRNIHHQRLATNFPKLYSFVEFLDISKPLKITRSSMKLKYPLSRLLLPLKWSVNHPNICQSSWSADIYVKVCFMTGDEVLYIHENVLNIVYKAILMPTGTFRLDKCQNNFSQRIPLSFVTSDLTALSTRRLLRCPQHCRHINTLYLDLVFTVKGSIIQRLSRAEGVKKCSSEHLIFLDHLSN